jgi:tripartite-type tricarboxylate transporter receptor subunit TctC
LTVQIKAKPIKSGALNTAPVWFRTGLVFLLAILAHAELSAHAQAYPAGPVKSITQLEAGGGTDPAMRIVSDQLGKIWR